MVERGCPRCNGALYVDSFRAENKTFIEIICIICSRIWTPSTMNLLLASLREKGYAAKADHIQRLLSAAIDKERGVRLVT